jgi:uncharacterized protein (TIGR03067 family)
VQPPSGPQQPYFGEPGSAADPGIPNEEWSNVPHVSSADTYRPKGTPPNMTPIYWGIGAVAAAFILVPGIIWVMASLRHSSQMSQLQGDWLVDAVDVQNGVVSIKDSKLFTATRTPDGARQNEEELGTFSIDATTEPKSLDLVVTSGPNKGQTLLAIYAVEGDRLIIRLAGPGLPRPLRLERTGAWKYWGMNRAK